MARSGRKGVEKLHGNIHYVILKLNLMTVLYTRNYTSIHRPMMLVFTAAGSVLGT
jgi:hypothetical protein